jgi:hypothetical protein
LCERVGDRRGDMTARLGRRDARAWRIQSGAAVSAKLEIGWVVESAMSARLRER